LQQVVDGFFFFLGAFGEADEIPALSRCHAGAARTRAHAMSSNGEGDERK